MNKELISIIVPVYNVKKYISECIDSILIQTYDNIEIILIDDGSTDGSGELCDYYANIDERIVVIHKENGGLSDARNYGINIAKGQYIGFVDGDDWIEPEMYEKLYQRIISGLYDIAICGFIREYKSRSIQEPLKMGTYSQDEAMEKLLCGIELHDHAWSKLYKRSVFNNVRYPKGKYFEDVLTTYRTFLNSEYITVEPTPLYHYRQRGGSIVRNGFNSKMLELSAIESLSQDLNLSQWNTFLKDRRILVKQNLIYNLAVSASISEIKTNWIRINDFITEVKNAQYKSKILSRQRLFRLITMLKFLPNFLIFLILRLRKIHNIRFEYF